MAWTIAGTVLTRTAVVSPAPSCACAPPNPELQVSQWARVMNWEAQPNNHYHCIQEIDLNFRRWSLLKSKRRSHKNWNGIPNFIILLLITQSEEASLWPMALFSFKNVHKPPWELIDGADRRWVSAMGQDLPISLRQGELKRNKVETRPLSSCDNMDKENNNAVLRWLSTSGGNSKQRKETIRTESRKTFL